MNKNIHIRKKQYKKLGIPYTSERQAFDLMSYQARFILSGLRMFRKMKRVGLAPNDIVEDAYKAHDLKIDASYAGENEGRADAACKEARGKWNAILDKMIYAFDQIVMNYPDSPVDAWSQKVSSDMEEAGIPMYQKLTKNPDGSVTMEESNFPAIPDNVLKEHEDYHERIHEGLRLYAEYFQDLWD